MAKITPIVRVGVVAVIRHHHPLHPVVRKTRIKDLLKGKFINYYLIRPKWLLVPLIKISFKNQFIKREKKNMQIHRK